MSRLLYSDKLGFKTVDDPVPSNHRPIHIYSIYLLFTLY